MTERRKVMAIGLDGLTFDVLLPLVESGRLPVFRRLLEDGRAAVLRSVTNMSTGATWSSFATGNYPRRHHVLHDFHHSDTGYSLKATRGADVHSDPFWKIASAAGRNVVVVNVPYTYPVPAVNGAILAGIDAPYEGAPGFDYPPGTYRELKRAVPDYVIDSGAQSYFLAKQAATNPDALAAAAAEVTDETEHRTRAAEHLLTITDWDLLVVVYSLPDIWQHHFWSSLREEGSVGKAVIEAGYTLLDRQLERLLAHLPDDGVAVIFSDHGFGPLCGTRDDLNRWLAEQGFLTFAGASAGTLRGGWHGALSERLVRPIQGFAGAFAAKALRMVRARTSFRRRQQLLARVPALRHRVDTRLRMGGIDWSQTLAYAAIDQTELWLNVAGRQPRGTVLPAEYEATCDEIAARLSDWRDDQGRRILNAVEIRPYADITVPGAIPPDLALTWNPDAARPNLHPAVNGDHQPEGALIVSRPGEAKRNPGYVPEDRPVDGPGGRAVNGQGGRSVDRAVNGPGSSPVDTTDERHANSGRYRRFALPEYGLVDVAPLILAELGVPIPEMDGRVPIELTGRKES